MRINSNIKEVLKAKLNQKTNKDIFDKSYFGKISIKFNKKINKNG